MWIIMDENDEKRLRGGHGGGHGVDRTVKQLASLIIKIDEGGQSYTILKDRYKGETEQAPIEYLPDELKDRMVELLRWANDVSDDD